MERRHKPKFVTLREFPSVGVHRVRILEDRGTLCGCLGIREVQLGKGLSRYGIRIKVRSEVEFLRDVPAAVLRDPHL